MFCRCWLLFNEIPSPQSLSSSYPCSLFSSSPSSSFSFSSFLSFRFFHHIFVQLSPYLYSFCFSFFHYSHFLLDFFDPFFAFLWNRSARTSSRQRTQTHRLSSCSRSRSRPVSDSVSDYGSGSHSRFLDQYHVGELEDNLLFLYQRFRRLWLHYLSLWRRSIRTLMDFEIVARGYYLFCFF